MAYAPAEDDEPAPARRGPDPDQELVEPIAEPTPDAGRTSSTSSSSSYRPAPHPDLHHAEIARSSDPDLGPVVAYDAAQDPEACRVISGSLLGGPRLREPRHRGAVPPHRGPRT